jgi:hypothetical protein
MAKIAALNVGVESAVVWAGLPCLPEPRRRGSGFMRDLIVDLSLRERRPLAEREVYGKKVITSAKRQA